MEHEEYLVPIMPNRGWANLPEEAKVMYKGRYFQPNEDYELWLDRVCRTYSDDREHRGRMKQYFRNYWFHTSTPASSNAGVPEQGYPVSCFVQEVGDSREEIISAWTEGFYLGAKGAGIGRNWSPVRSVGEKVGKKGVSSGVIPFMKVDEVLTLAVSQGGLRRGSIADYLRTNHPEIEEFITVRDPSGDKYRTMEQLFTGVIADDKFMEAVEKRSTYDLVSPKTGELIKTIDAYDLFINILYQRRFRGAPYMLFIDNVNRQIPEEYKKEGWEVTTSQLCSEITLRTAPDYSNICVLSSINFEYYDEFSQDPELLKLFYRDVHRFVDNILQHFIDNAKKEKGFEKVVKAGEYERSIGIGAMGLHYLFQKKMIPFDSVAAKSLNQKIFRELHDILEESNVELAKEKGANPLSAKHGIMRRNVHITAIAPTASISTLCNKTSPSIEPLVTNAFAHKTNVQTTIIKNRILKEFLQSKGKDTDEVWMQILGNGGSVSNLDFLTEHEKEVFKTAFEIKQEAIIELAADRQKYIHQSQSLNLFILPSESIEYIYDIHMFAWAKGVKSLYYIRSDAPKRVGLLSDMKSAAKALDQFIGEEKKTHTFNECIYCG